MGNFIHGR